MHVTVCFLALGNERCIEIGGYAAAQPIRSYRTRRDSGCRPVSRRRKFCGKKKKENPFVSAWVSEAISGFLGFVVLSIKVCQDVKITQRAAGSRRERELFELKTRST